MPDSFIIAPNTTANVAVSASPITEGIFSNILMVLIKNNPYVEKINVQCTGCDIHFTVNPNVITFDRTVPGKKMIRRVELRNDSMVRLKWVATDVSEILKYFKIHPLSGFLNPNTKKHIELAFTPDESRELSKMEFKVYVS